MHCCVRSVHLLFAAGVDFVEHLLHLVEVDVDGDAAALRDLKNAVGVPRTQLRRKQEHTVLGATDLGRRCAPCCLRIFSRSYWAGLR